MKVIKKIGVLSFAKIEAVLMAIVGLAYGIIFAVFGGGALTEAGAIGAGYGVLGIIILPIMYAVMGFVLGAVGAYLYNLVAKRIGGIEIELV